MPRSHSHVLMNGCLQRTDGLKCCAQRNEGEAIIRKRTDGATGIDVGRITCTRGIKQHGNSYEETT